MDTAFGFQGDGYAILVADATAARSILVFKHDQDKIVELDSHKLLAAAGVAADSANFTEFIQKNLKYYELCNDCKLSTPAAANFIRQELATALRKGPFQTNLILGGYDKDTGVSLYWCDYFAALTKVPFGAHGYAGNFIISIFDRDWREGMDLESGLDLVRRCIHELHTRFLISQPKFVVKVVDANGIRTLEL